MLFTSTTLAVLGLATVATSHMIMNNPVPFGKSTLDNSPLEKDGSNFPCKQRTGVYNAEGASNSMPLGSTQSLSFTGSATHGGGSCQISITYDTAPTKSSTWKVIHSIQGGCPIRGVAGNTGNTADAVDPDTYPFTIPTSLPTGTAVLAWTWFNKIGNREMYMNCAPITLTASASKRSDEDEIMARNYTMLMERDTAAFNALPDMFVANIPVEDCTTLETKDLLFPNPGDSVAFEGQATSSVLAGPSGTKCGTAGASATVGSGSSATSAAASKATTSAVVVASSAPAVSGGVFATVAPSKATSAPVVSATPVVSVASSAVVASTPVASSAAPANTAGSSTGTTGTGSAIAAGTACTTEGEWNCIGGKSYQQCASGTWSVVMQLAAGTSCTAGESTNINITATSKKNKRAVRFSGQHLRRHVQKS